MTDNIKAYPFKPAAERTEADNHVRAIFDRLSVFIAEHTAEVKKIHATGAIAVVVFEIESAMEEAARTFGWAGDDGVFSMTSGKRKKMAQYFEQTGDAVSARWFNGTRPGRIFTLVSEATYLLNRSPNGDLSLEPGSNDESHMS